MTGGPAHKIGQVGEAGRVTAGWSACKRCGCPPKGAAGSRWSKERAMRCSRFALAGFLVLGLALVGTAGMDNAKKLVGLWEASKGKGLKLGMKLEFTKDGKLKFHAKIADTNIDLQGTYKVDGKKVTFTFDVMGEKKSDDHTIKALTRDRLVLENEQGDVNEFKLVKKKE
jgi:uncharacterized protein (TIGR03066 family)